MPFQTTILISEFFNFFSGVFNFFALSDELSFELHEYFFFSGIGVFQFLHLQILLFQQSILLRNMRLGMRMVAFDASKLEQEGL